MSPFAYFAHPHAPNLGLLCHVSPVIAIHFAFAVAAFALGLIQLLGAKGTMTHRVLGWTWVAMMMTVAVSSFFIRGINPGRFSLIHILSVVTVCTLPLGVYAARRHNVKMHGRTMTSLFVSALVIAGIFTFFPGRLVWRMFFG